MIVGDLVVPRNDPTLPEGAGLVVEERYWEDPGAPARNFGVEVFVLWSDGIVLCHIEEELTYAVDNHEDW